MYYKLDHFQRVKKIGEKQGKAGKLTSDLFPPLIHREKTGWLGPSSSVVSFVMRRQAAVVDRRVL